MTPEYSSQPDPFAQERREAHTQLTNAYSAGKVDLATFQDLSEKVWISNSHEELDELLAQIAPAADLPKWDLFQDSYSSDGAVAPQHGYLPQSAVNQNHLPVPRQAADPSSALPVTFSLMGGSERSGRWTMATTHGAVAIMGGTVIDLREASFIGMDVVVNCFALMGGVSIIVPPDMEVDVHGFGLMGGFGWERARDAAVQMKPAEGTPRVQVRGFALMGGVGIERLDYGQEYHG